MEAFRYEISDSTSCKNISEPMLFIEDEDIPYVPAIRLDADSEDSLFKSNSFPTQAEANCTVIDSLKVSPINQVTLIYLTLPCDF